MNRATLVHGFAQTGMCWGGVPAVLESCGFDVASFDAPGHGANASLSLDLLQTGEWLANEGGQGTYIGYSMGARMCLHTALLRPDVVDRLILISGTGGIEDPVERAARQASDDALALRIESTSIESFVDEWLSGPLFEHLAPNAQMRTERLRNTPAGLAQSLRNVGTGMQEPMWSALRRMQMPVLVLAGELDPKFAALGERLATCIGTNATLHIVAGAGHTVHLEAPDAMAALLRDWLSAEPRRSTQVGGELAAQIQADGE